MNVVKSASSSDIESARYVFKRTGYDEYLVIKSRDVNCVHAIGATYSRIAAEAFAKKHNGTLIIEGGNDMKPESTVNQRTITLQTIPQEVADAIEWARKRDGDTDGIVRHAVDTFNYVGPQTEVLRSIPFETLLSALVNGYVIEKSAEELAHDAIRTRYLYLKHNADNGGTYAREAASETIKTLNILGIKIEGVNA